MLDPSSIYYSNRWYNNNRLYNFKVHTFTGPGTFTVCSVGNAAGSNTVDYLVVAGGGGGGYCSGGGGGAGGFRESSDSFRLLYSKSIRC